MRRRWCPRIPRWLNARSRVPAPASRRPLVPKLRMFRLSYTTTLNLPQRNTGLRLGRTVGASPLPPRRTILQECSTLLSLICSKVGLHLDRRTGRIRLGPRQGILKHHLSPSLRRRTVPNLVLRSTTFYPHRGAFCPKTCPSVHPQRRINRAKLYLVPSGLLWIAIKAQLWCLCFRGIPRLLWKQTRARWNPKPPWIALCCRPLLLRSCHGWLVPCSTAIRKEARGSHVWLRQAPLRPPFGWQSAASRCGTSHRLLRRHLRSRAHPSGPARRFPW